MVDCKGACPPQLVSTQLRSGFVRFNVPSNMAAVDTWIVRGNAALLMRTYEMTGSWFAQVFVSMIDMLVSYSYARALCSSNTLCSFFGQIDLTQAPGLTWGSWQASLGVYERGNCSDGANNPLLPNVCNNVGT